MNITQTFYDNLSSQYDKLFLDWQATTHEQALILNKIFQNNGFDNTSRILDCACGIGTQVIGLASLGYQVTGSDISDGEIAEAKERVLKNNAQIRFEHADFCALSETFSEQFDIVIAMDNALPHMLSKSALEAAIKSIIGQIVPGGMFVASIRDYDALLMDKPPYSPPYIQYIIDDEKTLQISKFECEYRATRREELTNLLMANGCSEVVWKFPEETGFYQPIVIARK